MRLDGLSPETSRRAFSLAIISHQKSRRIAVRSLGTDCIISPPGSVTQTSCKAIGNGRDVVGSPQIRQQQLPV